MCFPVISNQNRPALEEAYDAGMKSFMGRPLYGPGEGFNFKKGGITISRPRGPLPPGQSWPEPSKPNDSVGKLGSVATSFRVIS